MVMPPPQSHAQPLGDPGLVWEPLPVTVLPVTVALEEISMKMPSAQLSAIRLLVIVMPLLLMSTQRPLQALSWMYELVMVTLSATHFMPPASYPQSTVGWVSVSSV